AAAPADGRTLRGAGRPDARPADAGPAAHGRRAGHDRDLHHPFHPRGGVPVRPRGRHDPAPRQDRQGDRHRHPAPTPACGARNGGSRRILPPDPRSLPGKRRDPRGRPETGKLRETEETMTSMPIPSHSRAPSLEEVEARVQAENRARKSSQKRNQILAPILLLVAILVIWEAAAAILSIPRYLLPAPTEIARTMVNRIELILQQSRVTSIEVMLGFGMSVVVGVPLAMGIVRWKAFSTAVYPLLVSAQTIPKVAVAPLFIVWFGFGLAPKVLIAFLIAFFPIVINTVMGLRAIE